MKKKLLEILACPSCKVSLELKAAKSKGDEIEEGELKCKKCKSSYPIKRSVPRFVKDDAYVDNFSMEWNVHRSTQLDSKQGWKESDSTFKEVTGFDVSKLKGKLVLDAGCGSGRYLEIASNYGAEVIGVDLSYAVDAAYQNLGKNKNVHIIQADIFKLPFKAGIFDYVYSIGVLHHTPNCHAAFTKLVPLLGKKGRISIWLYSKKIHFMATDMLRMLTTRMDKKALYELCKSAVPYIYKASRNPFGYPLRAFISTHHDPEWRILDTFDWYSPKYQSKHSYEEVELWFRDAGLENIKRTSKPTGVTGELSE